MFRRLPASPVSSAGTMAMIAPLLGEMKRPWPMPKIASASITSGMLAAEPSRKTWSTARPPMQTAMPDAVTMRAPKRS